MKEKILEINLSNNIYKRVKKKKKTIYFTSDDNLSLLKDNESVTITDGKKHKKRKIKKIYKSKNLEELNNMFEKKQKYVFSDEIDKGKITAIEFSYSPRLFRKFFLLLFGIIILFAGYYFSSSLIGQYQSRKLKNNLTKLKNDEVSYVILEINPKILIELKGEQITNTSCLNPDCQKVFGKENLIELSLNNAIEKLYQKAQENGVDVSKGVILFTTNEKIKEKASKFNYVTYKKITRKEEQDLISQVDNEEIKKQVNKKDYNQELLNIYKKDSDYGKLYECSINNNEIECYITKQFDDDLAVVFNIVNFNEIYANLQKLDRLLDKFNVQYNYVNSVGLKDVTEIYVDGVPCWFGKDIEKGECGENGCTSKTFKHSFLEVVVDDGSYLLPFARLNLINQQYNHNDLIDWN